MKGIILVGGLATRLYPLTTITNKHLLPVYDKPMVYYPLQALVNAGIQDIMLVTGGNSAGDFLRLIGNGHEFGLKHLHYTYQEQPGGIAQALGLANHFAAGDRVVVMLGDNVIEKNIKKTVDKFQQQPKGAKIILTEVEHPEHYGVPVFDGDRIVAIEEKPQQPKSKYAVIGIYMYDSRVFDIIETLKPSSRGELEITDVNNAYIREGTMTYDILDGWWGDCGATYDELFRVSSLVVRTGANKMDK